jgi:hypothetical protein
MTDWKSFNESQATRAVAHAEVPFTIDELADIESALDLIRRYPTNHDYQVRADALPRLLAEVKRLRAPVTWAKDPVSICWQEESPPTATFGEGARRWWALIDDVDDLDETYAEITFMPGLKCHVWKVGGHGGRASTFEHADERARRCVDLLVQLAQLSKEGA